MRLYVVGNCCHCGAPVYAPRAVWSEGEIRVYHTCRCFKETTESVVQLQLPWEKDEETGVYTPPIIGGVDDGRERDSQEPDF